MVEQDPDPHGGDPASGTADGAAVESPSPGPAGARGQAPTGPTAALRHRLMATVGLLALVVVVLDQATKAWAVAGLTGHEPVTIIDGVLRLNLVRNPGAAFSFASGTTWIFTVIAIAVSCVVVRVSRRLGSLWWAMALGLLLGGAVGNLIDRLVRSPGFGTGHVVDFLELPHWPVFNVADSCIVASACMLVLATLRGIEVDGSRTAAVRRASSTAGE